MTGHLGTRVSGLLDGRLSVEETERAWAHVHACHACRDLVEREGWVKTRLACLSFEPGAASAHLKGSLMGMPPGDLVLAQSRQQSDEPSTSRVRRTVAITALGGGAVGCAVMGVLVFGAIPANAPEIDRRAPVTQLYGPIMSPPMTPSSATTPSLAPSLGP